MAAVAQTSRTLRVISIAGLSSKGRLLCDGLIDSSWEMSSEITYECLRQLGGGENALKLCQVRGQVLHPGIVGLYVGQFLYRELAVQVGHRRAIMMNRAIGPMGLCPMSRSLRET